MWGRGLRLDIPANIYIYIYTKRVISKPSNAYNQVDLCDRGSIHFSNHMGVVLRFHSSSNTSLSLGHASLPDRLQYATLTSCNGEALLGGRG